MREHKTAEKARDTGKLEEHMETLRKRKASNMKKSKHQDDFMSFSGQKPKRKNSNAKKLTRGSKRKSGRLSGLTLSAGRKAARTATSVSPHTKLSPQNINLPQAQVMVHQDPQQSI